MGHQHHHNHSHSHSHDHSNITVAFFLNFSFTIIEIIGGLWTNSLAILSDALHDLGDTISLGLSWYMEKVSKKGRDHKFSYGYKRFSMLAAIINSIVLIVGSVLILVAAFPRLFSPEPVDSQGMFFIAILGVVVNGVAVLKVRTGKTMNEKVITWHLLEDVLGWIAVLMISVVMMMGDFPILDPLFSICFTMYILWNVLKNLKQTLFLFLQSIPDEIDIETLHSKILENPHVEEIHDTHVWSMDGAYHILTAHLVIQKRVTIQEQIEVKHQVRKIAEQFNISHVTLELEHSGEHCTLNAC